MACGSHTRAINQKKNFRSNLRYGPWTLVVRGVYLIYLTMAMLICTQSLLALQVAKYLEQKIAFACFLTIELRTWYENTICNVGSFFSLIKSHISLKFLPLSFSGSILRTWQSLEIAEILSKELYWLLMKEVRNHFFFRLTNCFEKQLHRFLWRSLKSRSS